MSTTDACAKLPAQKVAGVLAAIVISLWPAISAVPAWSTTTETAAISGDTETAPPVGSRFILTSHEGRTVTDDDFRGKHLLVFFGYTHCPDVCPTSLLTVTRVLELLAADADKVQPLFITVDPARDSSAVLAPYVSHFDKRIIGLTGAEAMIERVAMGYRVKYVKVPGSGGDGFYTMDHTAALFHMGPDGSYIGRFPYETPAEDIAAKLKASFSR